MTCKHLLLTTALAGLLAAGQAHAQAQGGGQAGGSGQQGTTAGQAQGGLPGQRLAQEQAQTRGTQIYVSTAGTRQIQQALNKAGYSVGNVDGQWNQETQSATRNQQAKGLEPTGTLTLRTILALGLEDEVLNPQSIAQGAGQAQGGVPGQRLAQETAQGQGTPLYISPAGTRQIEQALNKAGYSGGNVNGAWDRKTAEAARNFQQANGLEPTGTLTTETMAALGMTNWMQGGQGGSPTATGAIRGGAGGAGGQQLKQQGTTGGAAGAVPRPGAGGATSGSGGAGQTITITPQQPQ